MLPYTHAMFLSPILPIQWWFNFHLIIQYSYLRMYTLITAEPCIKLWLLFLYCTILIFVIFSLFAQFSRYLLLIHPLTLFQLSRMPRNVFIHIQVSILSSWGSLSCTVLTCTCLNHLLLCLVNLWLPGTFFHDHSEKALSFLCVV